MTQRELELAKKAASKFLYKKPNVIAVTIPELPLKRINKKSTGAVKALQLRYRQANEAYEQNKKDGVTMLSVEAQFGLKPKTLKNWRSYRMLRRDSDVKRINKVRKYETA